MSPKTKTIVLNSLDDALKHLHISSAQLLTCAAYPNTPTGLSATMRNMGSEILDFAADCVELMDSIEYQPPTPNPRSIS